METFSQFARTLLEELADWLVYEDCQPVEWVVCGGVALALQDLTARSTRDVDVIGQWDAVLMQITRVEEFPQKVRYCIGQVAKAHPELKGMNEHWVNLGPRRLAEWGLPRGFEQRMTKVQFKDRLTLHLLGRADLIPLKLYAAADDLASRQRIHMSDLRLLKPTFDELDVALAWVLSLPDIDAKKIELQSIVEELGHGDLADYI